MKRVLVVGCPGAGKSTFSRALKRKTGLPITYLDLLYHRANKTVVSRLEFDIKLFFKMLKKEWIIDGNFNRTMEWRFRRCDTVFLLDYPVEVCLNGVKERIGKPRVDMPWVETELALDFKEFILTFEEKKLKRIYALIEKYEGKKDIIIFKSRDEANTYLEKLSF